MRYPYHRQRPTFASTEFKEFAALWGFEHVTSSPLCAQSNGEVERAVQTMKAKLNNDVLGTFDPPGHTPSKGVFCCTTEHGSQTKKLEYPAIRIECFLN